MEEESCIATVNTIAINVHCTTHFEKTTHFEFFFSKCVNMADISVSVVVRFEILFVVCFLKFTRQMGRLC